MLDLDHGANKNACVCRYKAKTSKNWTFGWHIKRRTRHTRHRVVSTTPGYGLPRAETECLEDLHGRLETIHGEETELPCPGVQRRDRNKGA